MEKIDPLHKQLAYVMRQCADEDKSTVLNLMLKRTGFQFSEFGGQMCFDQMLSELEEMIRGSGCSDLK